MNDNNVSSFEEDLYKELNSTHISEVSDYLKDLRLDEANVKLGFFEAGFNTGNGYVDAGLVFALVILVGVTINMLSKPISEMFRAWHNK